MASAIPSYSLSNGIRAPTISFWLDRNVLLMVENLKEKSRRQKAEITLHVKGRDIFVEQSHEDLYAAIDQLVDKLDRQVYRHKDRIRDYQHEPARRQAANLM